MSASPSDAEGALAESAEPAPDTSELAARKATAARRVSAPRAKASAGYAAKLSAKELAECKKRGIDPAEFAARKASAVWRR